MSLNTQQRHLTSLSARRAWIEIAGSLDDILAGVVALRKESVDRNYIIKITLEHPCVALRKESVDRNSWLEIFLYYQDVALRKESVDRNYPPVKPVKIGESRSPQGERG